MKRYDIVTLPFGGIDPRESDTGTWVKYNDVAEIIRTYMKQNPEEYDSVYESLFTAQELHDMSMSLMEVSA